MFFFIACVTGADSESAAKSLHWYSTCGDPACSGYSGPFEGIELCTTETEGAACETEGTTCDPVDDCNAKVVCAYEDPKDMTGGCPISRVAHKTDVVYLDAEAQAAAAGSLLAMPLASWRYRWEPAGTRHLGFLIDDVEGSAAVAADGEHVDLYGYTSMTVAAVQAQQARIEAQQAELALLRAEVAAMRAELAAMRR